MMLLILQPPRARASMNGSNRDQKRRMEEWGQFEKERGLCHALSRPGPRCPVTAVGQRLLESANARRSFQA